MNCRPAAPETALSRGPIRLVTRRTLVTHSLTRHRATTSLKPSLEVAPTGVPDLFFSALSGLVPRLHAKFGPHGGGGVGTGAPKSKNGGFPGFPVLSLSFSSLSLLCFILIPPLSIFFPSCPFPSSFSLPFLSLFLHPLHLFLPIPFSFFPCP